MMARFMLKMLALCALLGTVLVVDAMISRALPLALCVLLLPAAGLATMWLFRRSVAPLRQGRRGQHNRGHHYGHRSRRYPTRPRVQVVQPPRHSAPSHAGAPHRPNAA